MTRPGIAFVRISLDESDLFAPQLWREFKDTTDEIKKLLTGIVKYMKVTAYEHAVTEGVVAPFVSFKIVVMAPGSERGLVVNLTDGYYRYSWEKSGLSENGSDLESYQRGTPPVPINLVTNYQSRNTLIAFLIRNWIRHIHEQVTQQVAQFSELTALLIKPETDPNS